VWCLMGHEKPLDTSVITRHHGCLCRWVVGRGGLYCGVGRGVLHPSNMSASESLDPLDERSMPYNKGEYSVGWYLTIGNVLMLMCS
jgi:hypothetical protein